MSTFDKCERCGLIYQVSGFFAPGDSIPEEMKLLSSMTRQQHLRLRQVVDRSGYQCNWCLMQQAKLFGLLNPCTRPPEGRWCCLGLNHDRACQEREEPPETICKDCDWDKFTPDGWCLCPKEKLNE